MSRWTAPIGSRPSRLVVGVRSSAAPRFLLSHPERKFRFIGVVRAAAQLQVVNARRASLSERDDVVILEKPALGASAMPRRRTRTARRLAPRPRASPTQGCGGRAQSRR